MVSFWLNLVPILHFPISPTLNHGKFCSPIFFVFISFGFYFALLSILTGSPTCLVSCLSQVLQIKHTKQIFKARIHVFETTYGTILSTACSLLCVLPAGDMCPLMPLGLPTSYYLDVNSVPRDGFYVILYAIL